MGKKKTFFIVMMALNTLFFPVGCKRSTTQKTIRRLSYFEGESRFIGTAITTPADPEKYKPGHGIYEIFWDIKGKERKVAIPTPTIYATFCEKLNKIVVPNPQTQIVLQRISGVNPAF